MKTFKLIGNIVFGLTLAFSLGFLLLYLAGNAGMASIPKAYVVFSGSMEPAISLGSVVIVKSQLFYDTSDIITYAKDGDTQNPVTHRIVKLIPSAVYFGDAQYQTAGDANKTPDLGQVEQKDVIGRVMLTLPYLGYAVDFVKHPTGFILLIIVPATIIVYEELKAMRREFSALLQKLKVKSLSTALSGEAKIPKAAIVLPLVAALLVFAATTHSFFSDREISVTNSFAVYVPTSPPAQTPILTPTPTQTPGYESNILINEFVVNPGPIFTKEWVELINVGTSSVDLSGWSLVNDASYSKSISSLGTIDPNTFKVHEEAEEWLNNTGGDTVFLKDTNGNVIDSHTYTGNIPDDVSIGRQNDASTFWKTCTSPTKGTSNNGGC